MVLRPRGFSQIYVRIGLEEQSRQSKAGKKAKQAQRKQNRVFTLVVLDLRRGYATSCPPRQVNDSNKGSNGPAGSRSGKLHSE